jgi:hypothetical protein
MAALHAPGSAELKPYDAPATVACVRKLELRLSRFATELDGAAAEDE